MYQNQQPEEGVESDHQEGLISDAKMEVLAESEFDFVGILASKGFYFQSELCDSPSEAVRITFWQLASNCALFSRMDFGELHTGYEPVHETYLLSKEFDEFCPPEQYLQRLNDELGPDTKLSIFLEALGCYIELDQQRRTKLNSLLKIPVPSPGRHERAGIVLMCWDRIREAGQELGVPDVLLLDVVGFHEHSHAARAASLLRHGDWRILQTEETLAQSETYMFLRSRTHPHTESAIDTMKELINWQPLCYQIRMP